MQKDSSPKQRDKHIREKAVALQYRDLDTLPTICASGVGQLAREIIALARRNNVRVEQDGALTEMLAALRTGDSINPESFRLVAELICFLYHADCDWRKKHGFLDAVMEDGLQPGSAESAPRPLKAS